MYKLTNSTNPSIVIDGSICQLIKTITSGYFDKPIGEIPYWLIYRRPDANNTSCKMTKHPVSLHEIPYLLAEWNDNYGPATYNAFPRGTIKSRHHTYCKHEAHRLEIRSRSGKLLALFDETGNLLYAHIDVSDSFIHYQRRKYFTKIEGKNLLNLYQVAGNSETIIKRRFHS